VHVFDYSGQKGKRVTLLLLRAFAAVS